MTSGGLFRGYIKTEGKTPTQRFKDVGKLPSLSDVKDFPEYAGVLDQETVLIDVDDKDQAETLLRILTDKKIFFVGYRTTRGIHFYFRNNGRFTSCKTGVKLAVGLSADIKVGLTNSIGVLKYKGLERPRIDGLEEDQEVDEVPFFLTSMHKCEELYKLQEGDGRNSALFNQLLHLANAGLSYDEAVETLRIINEYVFAERVSDREFRTVTRKGAFPKEVFMEEGHLSHSKVANYLIAKHSMKKVNGVLYGFNGKKYTEATKLENSFVEHDVIKMFPNSKKNFRSEVFATIRGILSDEELEVDTKHICFENGLLDLTTWKLCNHSPEFFIKNSIPHDYSPEAYSEGVDKALNDWCCNDPEVRALVEEMIGVCLSSSTGVQKMFVIFGEKNNGKTTFFKVLNPLFGDRNVSHLSLQAFGNRFSSIQLQNKLVNIGDDISDETLTAECVSIVKQIVTGYSITGEYKGVDAIHFRPYSTLVFSTNNMPSLSDRTGAFARRLCFIPFDKKFAEGSKERKTDFEEELLNERSFEYLIRIGVEGLRRVLLDNHGRLSHSDKAEALKERIITHVDTVRSFVEEFGEIVVLGRYTRDVYEEYVKFCKENEFYALSHLSFVKTIGEAFGFVPSPRNGFKVFVRKQLDGKTTKTTKKRNRRNSDAN